MNDLTVVNFIFLRCGLLAKQANLTPKTFCKKVIGFKLLMDRLDTGYPLIVSHAQLPASDHGKKPANQHLAILVEPVERCVYLFSLHVCQTCALGQLGRQLFTDLIDAAMHI